jgi:hypothetical protein
MSVAPSATLCRYGASGIRPPSSTDVMSPNRAVKRCQQRYGEIAQFFRASFEEIEGFWDVIYCSNVLERFEQHLEIAAVLLGQ